MDVSSGSPTLSYAMSTKLLVPPNGANVAHLPAEIEIADPTALARQIDLARYSRPQVIARCQTSTMLSLRRKDENRRDSTRIPTSLSKAGRFGGGRILATAHDYSTTNRAEIEGS